MNLQTPIGMSDVRVYISFWAVRNKMGNTKVHNWKWNMFFFHNELPLGARMLNLKSRLHKYFPKIKL